MNFHFDLSVLSNRRKQYPSERTLNPSVERGIFLHPSHDKKSPIMAPSFDHLREADLDDDEFNEDDIDISDLREKFEVQLEQGYDSFVVIDGLPKVTEEQKPKLVKFLLKKLNTVGKTREDLIYMPMGDDGSSMQ